MFPANVKVWTGEMKVQKIIRLLSFCSTDDNTQYCYFHSLFSSKSLKQQINFLFSKRQSIIKHK